MFKRRVASVGVFGGSAGMVSAVVLLASVASTSISGASKMTRISLSEGLGGRVGEGVMLAAESKKLAAKGFEGLRSRVRECRWYTLFVRPGSSLRERLKLFWRGEGVGACSMLLRGGSLATRRRGGRGGGGDPTDGDSGLMDGLGEAICDLCLREDDEMTSSERPIDLSV